jgi:hypothetical protein
MNFTGQPVEGIAGFRCRQEQDVVMDGVARSERLGSRRNRTLVEGRSHFGKSRRGPLGIEEDVLRIVGQFEIDEGRVRDPGSGQAAIGAVHTARCCQQGIAHIDQSRSLP